MKYGFAALLGVFASTAFAAPFPNGDAQAGKKLFDQYQCASCHVSIVGGDGSAIFTRKDRKVKTVPQLIDQMHFCTANVGVNLSPQDEQHLGVYLNRYYNLK